MEVEEIWLVSEKQEDLGFHSNNIALSTDLTPTLVVTQTRTKKMKCTVSTGYGDRRCINHDLPILRSDCSLALMQMCSDAVPSAAMAMPAA
uniref:Uncharacterized protein n=1 Tax=Vespula pensylvanica TaxID=30213 RepID=A0A834P556_VESPE|nr:hypothetical protein H0235_005570 [Vespula pensylvanica]